MLADEQVGGGGEGLDLEEALHNFAHLVATYYDTAGAAASHQSPSSSTAAVLQAVLDAYERCKGTVEGTVHVPHGDHEGVCEHLQRVGFVASTSGGKERNEDDADQARPGVTMRLVHHAHLEAYEAAKNRARSEYHTRRAQKHEADFIGQLAAVFDLQHISHNESRPDETLFFANEGVAQPRDSHCPYSLNQAKAALSALVQKYRKVKQYCSVLENLLTVDRTEPQLSLHVPARW
jgi:hypothetical protein